MIWSALTLLIGLYGIYALSFVEAGAFFGARSTSQADEAAVDVNPAPLSRPDAMRIVAVTLLLRSSIMTLGSVRAAQELAEVDHAYLGFGSMVLTVAYVVAELGGKWVALSNQGRAVLWMRASLRSLARSRPGSPRRKRDRSPQPS